MPDEHPALPDFDSPPVVEVAISLQFEPLEALHSSHLGLLWNAFRSEGFSNTEDHAELAPVVEDFDPKPTPRVGVRLQAFDDAPPLPRIWFLNSARNELIQIQRDRFIVNWRKGADAQPYPRYVNIKRRLQSEFATFIACLASENLGAIRLTQCELTYVNHITVAAAGILHGDISSVVTTWTNTYSEPFLAKPEDVAFHARYKMCDEQGKPVGRLHVSFQPAYRATTAEPIFVMNMTARGEPRPADFEGALELFDREHEWIVRGFASITTEQMHKEWRRKHGS
jgi:uncharacterized protein (TIGR04255 family)